MSLSGGQAIFNLSGLSVGAHVLTALYGGDALSFGSTSATLTQVINSGASIADLIARVSALTLLPSFKHSLLSELRAAERALARHHRGSAIRHLRRFIRELQILARRGGLDPVVARALAAEAAEVIGRL